MKNALESKDLKKRTEERGQSLGEGLAAKMIPEKNINKQKKNNNQKDKTNKKKKKRKCYFCYKEKHYIKDCFERKNFKKTLIRRLQLHLKMMLTLMEWMSLLLQKSNLWVSGFWTHDVIFICVIINNCF